MADQNKNHVLLIVALIFTCLAVAAQAQEVVIPDPGLDAAIREALQKPSGPLTEQDLLSVTDLTAISRNISSLQGLEAAHNLTALFLDDNQLTGLSFANVLTNLTKLEILDLGDNPITNFTLPGGLTNLNRLRVEHSGLTNLTLPVGLTKLTELRLGVNQLTSLNLPADMTNLSVLSAFQNQLTNLTLPPALTNLSEINLFANQLSQLSLPAGLTQLSVLIVGANQLTSFTVPADMTNLAFLRLEDNQLTSITLPAGLNHLNFLVLSGNQLSNLSLPSGLTNLSGLLLQTNLLTSLTLPPDLTKLTTLQLDGNPLTTLVLPESLATSNLAATITDLQNQRVQVFTYPLSVQLSLPQQSSRGFRFAITGPPGVYSVFSSSDFTDWAPLDYVTNPLGNVLVTDAEAQLSPRKFYRVVFITPPTNMVFIAPNVFTLGSPASEVGHQPDESPLTDVSLTHGFWMAKYLVTQRDYLAVTGENPSGFPGNLDRPVESVSWFAASNYCSLLTAQDLAAGRIPPGSHYRLPTEAEWECAARAGTTTRFNYGDDPNVTSLINHAWYSANSGLMTQPVGQKLPNAWGLYDMAGNVWEWCQDWYGDYPGGDITDPQGPATNPIGWKVIRGGAWESSELDCRSARRWFEPASPFISDFIIGFRVVLAMEP